MNALPTFLTSISSVFQSRALLSGTLPALLAIGYAGLLVQCTTDWPISDLWATTTTGMALIATIMLVALTVLFQSINPVLIRWFCGDAPWIPRCLIQRQHRRMRALDAEVNSCLDRMLTYQQRASAWRQRLERGEKEIESDPGNAASAISKIICELEHRINEAGGTEVEDAPALLTSLRALVATGGGTLKGFGDAAFAADQLFRETERRLATTVAKRQAERQALYPEGDVVQPTRFGNYAAAIESYTQTRYGVAADILWPRLRQVDSTKEKWQAVDDAKAALEFTVACALVNMLAVTAALLLIPTLYEVSRTALLLIPFWSALAWFSYAASLQAVITLGAATASAIDLNRWTLLSALHLPSPANAQEEFKSWTAIGQFLGAPPTAATRARLWYK